MASVNVRFAVEYKKKIIDTIRPIKRFYSFRNLYILDKTSTISLFSILSINRRRYASRTRYTSSLSLRESCKLYVSTGKDTVMIAYSGILNYRKRRRRRYLRSTLKALSAIISNQNLFYTRLQAIIVR
jgi:hypothetical protein